MAWAINPSSNDSSVVRLAPAARVKARTGQQSPVSDQGGEDGHPQRQDPWRHHHGADHNGGRCQPEARAWRSSLGPQRGEHQERFVEFRVPVVAAVQLLEAITFLQRDVVDRPSTLRDRQLLRPTMTGGVPPDVPGSAGTTSVRPSHLSRKSLNSYLVVQAAVECVVTDGFLFGDLHLRADALSSCCSAICFCSMAARYSSAICRPVRSRPRTST